jgi:hypothetical protein
MRKGLEIGRCPLCNGDEDEVHILLKFPEIRRMEKHVLSRKWQIINEELVK